MSLTLKQHFVDELKRQLGETIAIARQAELAAAEPAEALRNETRQKEDAKSATQFARLAAGHRKRREKAAEETEALIRFATSGLRAFSPEEKAELGALVDVRIEAEGETEERTLFLLPVGAGAELAGPGGDGFVSVVTPASPVGLALHGAGVGDSFELTIAGQDREWTIVDLW